MLFTWYLAKYNSQCGMCIALQSVLTSAQNTKNVMWATCRIFYC